MVGRGGGPLGWALHASNLKPGAGVFISLCISEGNRLSSENVGYYFNFILHVMSDKAARAERGNLDLYTVLVDILSKT